MREKIKIPLIILILLLAASLSGCAGKDTTSIDTTAIDTKTIKNTENDISSEQTDTKTKISIEELAKHDHEGDCWVVYEGNVYDYSNAKMHPNMAKTFYSHCGNLTSFEEAAKAKHGGKSSEERTANYGTLIGEVE